MEPDVTHARQALEHARAMREHFQAQHDKYLKTPDPPRQRGVMGAEEMKRRGEGAEWTATVYEAEHALFRAEHGTPGIVGTHGDYRWLTTTDHDIPSLLERCPAIVVDRYLAITSVDSGPFRLADRDEAKGWHIAPAARVFQSNSSGAPEYREDCTIACSPRITSLNLLPDWLTDESGPGYNECYVFEQPAPPGDIESCVNWIGFRLYDPLFDWCAERLWNQLTRLAPVSYIGEGTVLTVVTREHALFSNILSALSTNHE